MRQESEVLLISSEDLKSCSEQDKRDSSFPDPHQKGNLAIKRTSSQPPIEADETVTEGADAIGMKSDHEMAPLGEPEIPATLPSNCVASPQPKAEVQSVQPVEVVMPEVVEQTIDDETRQLFQSKVGYFQHRIALYQRFGLEQFAKTQADIFDKFQVPAKVKDLEQFCERLTAS